MITPWETNKVVLPDTWKRLVDFEMYYDELRETLKKHGVEWTYVHDTRDIWCRDYCPVQRDDGTLVWFKYTPDYLKKHKHLQTDQVDMRNNSPLFWNYSWHMSKLVVDGGNIVVVDKDTVVMVDKVYKENNQRSRDFLRRKLKEDLKLKELLVIGKEPFDKIGHADGVLWAYAPRKVVINDYRRLEPAYRERLLKVLKRHKIEYTELPYKVPSYWHKSISAWGNYVNILQVRDLILVPGYGLPEDEEVRKKIDELTGKKNKVVTIDCRSIAKEGGCTNCSIWNYKVPN